MNDSLDTRKAIEHLLNATHSRKTLTELAKQLHVPVGKSKSDTAHNLLESGKLCFKLVAFTEHGERIEPTTVFSAN